MTPGMLIALEGGEGSGKSTQAPWLYGILCQTGRSARLVREPGGTALGQAIRGLVALPRQAQAAIWRASLVPSLPGSQLAAKDLWLPLRPEAELFLFAASRSQLVGEVLRPALARGTIIVCDRYIHSTLAYQGYGRGLDLGLLHTINRLATGGLEPDLVILLDIEPSRGLARKGRAAEVSRFEQEELAFHQRVRQGYLELAAQEPGRWFVVDASRPRREVSRLIWERVKATLPPPRSTPPSPQPTPTLPQPLL